MLVILDPFEPSALSFRHPVGVPLDLQLSFVDQLGDVVDPSTLNPQLVLTPRTLGIAYGYAMTIVSPLNGEADVQLPGNFFNDMNGYRLELYSRDVDGVPTALLAQGVVLLSGGAYRSLGPLGPMSVPTIEGPPGPEGPIGPQGIQGIQGEPGAPGSRWYAGDDYPGVSMPNPVGRVDGDMYLKNVDPDGGSVWRWNGVALAWVYTGADITGPAGPDGTMTAIIATAAPAIGTEGRFWYNPTTAQLFIQQGGAWVLYTGDWG